MTLHDVKINHSSLFTDWTSRHHDVIDAVPLLEENLHVNVLLYFLFLVLYKLFLMFMEVFTKMTICKV